MEGSHQLATPPLRRNRDFGLLFAAQIISLLGSGVTTVGLALFSYQLTGGSSATAVIGNALMLRILAFLLFSQPAGVIADRVSRKKILIASDLIRCGLLALFPFITAVWQVYLLIFAINAATAFFTPTFEASIPEVVGGEQYVKALSLSRVAVDVEAVAAPALAGLLVVLLGVEWVFWFDALTYLASAGVVLAANVPQAGKDVKPLSWPTFLGEITHGMRVLLREASLRQALTLSLAEATAGAVAIVATVSYVRDVLGRGDATFSLAMAGLGLGSSVAALALGRATGRYERGAGDPAVLHGRRHRWASLAMLAGGGVLGLILLPGFLMPPLAPFAVLWFLNGAGQALIAISSSTLLAEHTAEAERGRAYAAHFALTHAFWLATYPAVGHSAALWGAPATFTAAGAVCLLITALALTLGRGDRVAHLHR
ncbi:MFS transporter [Tautonia sociabilis]|uniref:MFS transporter n=1 Tax=Tautonia sociabilis TaxID=2080755 RepID=A0A432MPQ2_9BACT|nr:MFS transporter [Tautonia sociabilis]RUL89441.1 MFS transporter [Tautonia sociabilis]